MTRLLKANFFRLVKNKIFWGIVIITILIASFILFNTILNQQGETKEGIDNILVMYIHFIGIFIAIFTSLFVGTEYSDGVIRNKLIAGHSRISVYIANFIMSVVVGIIVEVIYLLIVASIGIPMFGGIQIPISDFLYVLLDSFMIIVFYAGIFTFISLICSNITISTVICLLLTLAMMIMAILQTPGDEILNIFPTGQVIQISWLAYREEANIQLLWVYSLGITFIINSIGIYLFNRKELKEEEFL